jgi:hypothetical protein
MNKYLITSPRFTGEISVLYGVDSKLLFIDFTKCDLTEEQIQYFKANVPVVFNDKFIDAFGSNNRLSVVEEGYKVTFEQFWNLYEHKVHRPRAEKQWNKLSEADHVNAYFKYAIYKRHLALNQWKSKAEPERYLKDRFWESEWK